MPNMIKIGITENIHKRKKQLENQSGCNLHIVGYTETHAAESCECFILSLYGYYRKNGEWLDVSEKKDRMEMERIFYIIYAWRDDLLQTKHLVKNKWDGWDGESYYITCESLIWLEDFEDYLATWVITESNWKIIEDEEIQKEEEKQKELENLRLYGDLVK